jgi:hypothetical protein
VALERLDDRRRDGAGARLVGVRQEDRELVPGDARDDVALA